VSINPADPRSVARSSWWSIAFLTAAAVALLVRTLATAEPLGIDQSLWASAVRGIARGQKLYQDVWEQRPPGIYLTYLAGFSLLGWNTATVAWLDVIASLVTTVLLYALGRTWGGRFAGSLAAALYAVLTMPAWLYSHGGFLERSVCETFIAVCVGVAAVCCIQLRRQPTVAAALGFGLSAGVAVVFKPNAVLCFPALFVWSLSALPTAGGRPPWRALLGTSVVALAGAAIVPTVTMIWLWRLGLIPEARTAVVDFNRWYVAAGFDPATYALAFSRAVWLRMKTDPLWAAGGVASVFAIADLARNRRLAPLPALAMVWGGGTILVIAVNGIRLFNSYFIQALAPLSLLVAWWFTTATSGSRFRRVAAAMTAVLMLVLLVQRNFIGRVADPALAAARVLTGRMDQTTYLERFGGYGNQRGYSARANQEAAAYLRTHTEAGDRVFLFGINGAGLYFLADRLAAHRFLRVNFFVPDDFPDARFTLSAVVADLEVRRPRYLVFERLHSGSDMAKAVDGLTEHAALRPLLERYVFEAQIEDFSLYRLR
jgi:hypothetical protein